MGDLQWICKRVSVSCQQQQMTQERNRWSWALQVDLFKVKICIKKSVSIFFISSFFYGMVKLTQNVDAVRCDYGFWELLIVSVAEDREWPLASSRNGDGHVARCDPATLGRLSFAAGCVQPLSAVHHPLDVSRWVRVGRVASEVQRVADFALGWPWYRHLSRCDCKMEMGELESCSSVRRRERGLRRGESESRETT